MLNFFGLKNGASAPLSLAIFKIFGSSVEMKVLEILLFFKDIKTEYRNNSIFSIFFKFFFLIRFEFPFAVRAQNDSGFQGFAR